MPKHHAPDDEHQDQASEQPRVSYLLSRRGTALARRGRRAGWVVGRPRLDSLVGPAGKSIFASGKGIWVPAGQNTVAWDFPRGTEPRRRTGDAGGHDVPRRTERRTQSRPAGPAKGPTERTLAAAPFGAWQGSPLLNTAGVTPRLAGLLEAKPCSRMVRVVTGRHSGPPRLLAPHWSPGNSLLDRNHPADWE